MSMNSQSSIMSETVNLVRFFKVLSLSNRCDITVKALSMGVFVNSETTSWDAKVSSSSTIIEVREPDKCLEFLTWYSVFPTRGPKISASERDVL